MCNFLALMKSIEAIFNSIQQLTMEVSYKYEHALFHE